MKIVRVFSSGKFSSHALNKLPEARYTHQNECIWFRKSIQTRALVIWMCFLLCGLGELNAQQTLSIQKNDGSKVDFSINSVDKLIFQSAQMELYRAGGSRFVFPLSSVQRLSFEKTETSINHEISGVENKYKVFPNPISDELILHGYITKSLTLQIGIFNFNGQELVQKTASVNPGKNQVNINLPNLPAGIYLCRVVYGLSIEIHKFIKQ